jgi:shikimate kinase
MSTVVVSFEGPVGVGKTTLGMAVSERLNIGFIDGDDF